ncbi:MarR family winged helix-turn-helix transcriptional regulator [Pseudoroseicyclus tamaricis]|uniref:MarR family transcriptional regulator n=1 Tax=Pseudoroseicyclus tamaricis TaxID=2705421 RepID=A0A6B2JS72_9RHOB|nr:MarR family transcriptional regulator [Pseudoroseicyclus tamaricis]NDV00845.1 MarR family transcriptional regulator [Pseudoroseicyclus tamaricis]
MPREPNLDALVCFDIYSANLAIGRLYKPLLEPLGLTYPQYLVLKVLWETDAQSLGTIGRRLGLESSTLTPLVKRLEARGLVTRLRDTGDERRVVVSLAEAGRVLEARTEGFARCLIEGTGMSVAEMEQIHRLMRKLTAGTVQQA